MTSSHGVLDALTTAGVSFRVHEHPPARNSEELHLTGLDINTSAKTLAFTLTDGRVVLAAIPGASRLRYPKLAAALGVSRSALKPADATVLAGLGMLPGGVAPFTTAEVTLVVERSLLDFSVLYCGGGKPELSVELSPAAWLQAMPQAIISDLCEETLAQ